MNDRFWTRADELVATSEVVIDRPRSSVHPRYAAGIYPLDYGHLSGTIAMDGGEVDLWRGSLPEPRVTGAILTVDTLKRDAEVKLLLGCTRAEAETAVAFHNARPDGKAGALLVMRPWVAHAAPLSP